MMMTVLVIQAHFRPSWPCTSRHGCEALCALSSLTDKFPPVAGSRRWSARRLGEYSRRVQVGPPRTNLQDEKLCPLLSHLPSQPPPTGAVRSLYEPSWDENMHGGPIWCGFVVSYRGG